MNTRLLEQTDLYNREEF